MVTFGAEATGINPSLGRYNGGGGGGLNPRRISYLHKIGHFIRPDRHVLKLLSLVMRLEVDAVPDLGHMRSCAR